ncbi:hypothetical protein K9L67_04640 [Candidatus Woesearchaeota archaeon]|nr:hypothetical protein [Candidatus Woesearchaeota archaeon]MCF7901487.1 hypothetical protein [Candidatus Woesearchaeota archaeon]MCF8013180.1 hypothetical protein [Candidatus Woesearchaeota archaeon]
MKWEDEEYLENIKQDLLKKYKSKTLSEVIEKQKRIIKATNEIINSEITVE